MLDELLSIVLLVRSPGTWEGAPYEVTVEPLSASVAAVLGAAESGLGPADRSRLAAEWEVDEAQLDGLLRELVDEGVLVAGSAAIAPSPL